MPTLFIVPQTDQLDPSTEENPSLPNNLPPAFPGLSEEGNLPTPSELPTTTPPVQNPRPAQTPRSVGVTRRPLTLPTLFPEKIDTTTIKRQPDSFTISTIHPSGQESRKRYFHFTMLPALSSEVSFSNASIFKKTHQVPEARPGIPIVTKMHHRNIVIPGCHNVIQTLGLERKYMTLVGAFMPTDHFTTNPSKSTSRYKTSQQAAQGFESIVVFGLTRIEINITVNTSANHTEKIELTGSVVEFKTYLVYQNLSYYSITLLVDSDLWQQRPAQEQIWNVLPPQVSEKRNTNVGTEISRAGAGAEAGAGAGEKPLGDSGQQREQVASNPIFDIFLGGRAEAATPPNQNNPNAPNTPNIPTTPNSEDPNVPNSPNTPNTPNIPTTPNPNDPFTSPNNFSSARSRLFYRYYRFTVSSVIPSDTQSKKEVLLMYDTARIIDDVEQAVVRFSVVVPEGSIFDSPFIAGVIVNLENELDYVSEYFTTPVESPRWQVPKTSILYDWVREQDGKILGLVDTLSVSPFRYPAPIPQNFRVRIDIKERRVNIFKHSRHLIIEITPATLQPNIPTTTNFPGSPTGGNSDTASPTPLPKEITVSVAVVNTQTYLTNEYGYIKSNNQQILPKVKDVKIDGQTWASSFSRDVLNILNEVFKVMTNIRYLSYSDTALVREIDRVINNSSYSIAIGSSVGKGIFILRYKKSENQWSNIALRFTKDQF